MFGKSKGPDVFHVEPFNSIKTIVTACRSCCGKRGGKHSPLDSQKE
jgi:hypothetical protein